MSEQEISASETNDNEAKNPENNESGSWKQMGKIFLLAGIVLAQAVGAYAIINTYYPSIQKLTSKSSSGKHTYFQFKNIIANTADSNGDRYLIMTIAVELNNADDLNAINKKKAEIQDHINLVISNYTAAQLNNLKDRKNIKKELGITINKVIGKKAVRNLFFTKYILQ